MVEVGDKVFVAPLYGQKDNLAVITGPAGAGASFAEGAYNTWTKQWTNAPNNGIMSAGNMDILLDDKNGKLSILYEDSSSKKRFGIYNISDFSVVYESPVGVNYTYDYPNLSNKDALHLGTSYFAYGGFSQSIQTYLLLLRSDMDTIEVWQGGASAVWTTNAQTDFGADSTCDAGGISITGKYVLVVMYETSSPYDYYLMLYQGSYV